MTTVTKFVNLLTNLRVHLKPKPFRIELGEISGIADAEIAITESNSETFRSFQPSRRLIGDVEVDWETARFLAITPMNPKDEYTLSTAISECRKSSKMTLDDLAIQTGISKTYLWELEVGKATDPSFAIIVRLARVYGINLNVLAGAIP